MDEQEHLQRLALEECSVTFVNKLDVTAILPHLIAFHLLTNDDRQILMTYAKTQVEKAQYLLDILPRKARGWFEKFAESLRQSGEGTGHGDLLLELEAKFAELIAQHDSKKSKKKVLKLRSKPSSVEEQRQPVGSRQVDVSKRQSCNSYLKIIIVVWSLVGLQCHDCPLKFCFGSAGCNIIKFGEDLVCMFFSGLTMY